MYKRIKNKKPRKPKSRIEYLPDSPLTDPTHDELNRLPFSVQISNTIASRTDASPLIVGLYGEWGAGKTTLLNFVKSELQKKDNVICFNYNPWRFPDETSLIKSFFAILAAELHRQLKGGKELLGDLVGILGKLIPSISAHGLKVDAGKPFTSLGEMLSETKLEEVKARLEELLQQEQKRVVVLMDDIDRMDNSEIQALFKLIKLSADFSYVTYVLAFDDDLVALALSEKYGQRGLGAGRRFLEKIIQVPLQMPATDAFSLRTFTMNLVESALDDQGIDLDHDSFLTFMALYNRGLGQVIRTPRLAKQYANALSFSLPLLKTEVNTVDLMLVEGIRIAYPRLYKELKKNKHIVLGTSLDDDGTPANQLKERAEELISRCLKDFPREEVVAAKSILTALFPRLRALLTGLTVVPRHEEDLATDKRVGSEEYFDRYFTYSIQKHDVSDRDVLALVTDSTAKDYDKAVRDFLQDETSHVFLRKLSRLAKDASPASAIKLALALVRNADRFEGDKPRRLVSIARRSDAAFVVTQFLSRLPKHEVINSAQRIIVESRTLTCAYDCLSIWLKPPGDLALNPIILTEGERLQLRKALLKRMDDSNKEKPLYKSYGDSAARLYLFWADNKKAVGATSEEAFGRALVNNPHEALAIIRCFITESVSSVKGRQNLFSNNNYKALSSVVRPEIIVGHLQDEYRDSLDVEPIAGEDRFHPETDIEVARLFYFLWKNALEVISPPVQ